MEHGFSDVPGHNDIAAVVSVSGFQVSRGQYRLGCFGEADTGELNRSGADICAQRAFGAGDIEASFGQPGIAVGVERGACAVGVLEDCDLVIDHGGAFGKWVDTMGIFPGLVCGLAIAIGAEGVCEMFVFRQEEVLAAEARGFDRDAADQPVGDIEVMAAFFEQMGTGVFPVAAPVTVDIAAVVKTESFIELEGNDISEIAGIDDLLYFLVKSCVAQHQSEEKDPVRVCIVCILQADTVFDGCGQRFFAKNVLAGFEGGDCLVCVVAIPGTDHYPVDVGPADQLGVAGADICLWSYFAFQTFGSLWVWVVQSDNLQLIPFGNL